LLKAIRIALFVLGLLVSGLLVYALSNSLYTQRPVGFQQAEAPDQLGRPIPIAIWYPTEAKPWPTSLLQLNLMSVARNAPVAGGALPLVLISHGNGGGPGSHADLALALAEHGFVVAGLMHPGDNYADQSAAGTGRWLVDRTRQVRSALDYMLTLWPSHRQIDANRIGMFGFSAGGFTALTAVGGAPDLRLIASHCKATPEFVCKLLTDVQSPLLDPSSVPPASEFLRDARIKAAVIAAPGLGFTFVPNGLATVSVPVQLWSGDSDQNVPTATNAKPVSHALAARAELREVAGASHFSFLAPCRLLGPPVLCREAGGFDRPRFHTEMNEAAVEFFQRKM
jgi:predicted dienelactone hydrolase